MFALLAFHLVIYVEASFALVDLEDTRKKTMAMAETMVIQLTVFCCEELFSVLD